MLLLAGCSIGSAGHRDDVATWHYEGLRQVLIHSIAFGKSGREIFAASERGIYRKVGSGPWRNVLKHKEIWDVAASSTGRTVVAADNAGDVDVSDDSGNLWREHGISSGGVYSVTLRPDNPNWILVGAAGGIFLSKDGGSTWKRTTILHHSATDSFSWLPGSSRVVFAGNVPGGPKGVASVLESTDAGMHWSHFDRQLTRVGMMSVLAVGPGAVLAGSMGLGVWRSPVGSPSWSRMASGMPPKDDHGSGLVETPGHPPEVWVGTLGYGIFRSSDGGRRWTADSKGLPQLYHQRLVLGLAYRPADQSLYAATNQGLYRLALRRT